MHGYLLFGVLLGIVFYIWCYLFLYALYWKLPRNIGVRFIFRLILLATVLVVEARAWFWANDRFAPTTENLRLSFFVIWAAFAVCTFVHLASLSKAKWASLADDS